MGVVYSSPSEHTLHHTASLGWLWNLSWACLSSLGGRSTLSPSWACMSVICTYFGWVIWRLPQHRQRIVATGWKVPHSKQRKGGGSVSMDWDVGGGSSLACLYHIRLCMYALFPRPCHGLIQPGQTTISPRTDPAWANHNIIRSVACYRGLPSLKNVLLGSYDWENLLWHWQICLMVWHTREKRGDKKHGDDTPPGNSTLSLASKKRAQRKIAKQKLEEGVLDQEETLEDESGLIYPDSFNLEQLEITLCLLLVRQMVWIHGGCMFLRMIWAVPKWLFQKEKGIQENVCS
jgi:hypothetical protein